MSEFKEWLYAKNSPVNPDGLTSEVINVMQIAYEAAVERCKQGEPFAWSYSQRHADGHISSHLSSTEPNKKLVEYGNIFEVDPLFLHSNQPDADPQPPTDNDHVAEGCELFTHAMPKSDEQVITKLRDLYLRALTTSTTIYELTTVPLSDLKKILDIAYTTPQPSTDVSESLGKAIHVLKTTEIWLDTMPVTTQSSITLHELVKTVLDQISPSPSTP